MRNIKHVVLWELPPSFCGLVQRAGRAARDFSTLGEAILIVSQSVITKGTTEMEVEATLEAVQTEAENRGDEEVASLENNGMQLVDEGGVRIGHESEEENEEEKKEEKKRRRKQTKANFNSQETKFLSLFASTTQCRRIVWDDFFGNKTKCTCHNCQSLHLY
jgi:superfamily II DNA helicase RecQ